jgi:hypothetical protein
MGIRVLNRCIFCTSLIYTPRTTRTDMAKGSSDVILRDRLQFDVDATGDTALVYGRIDLSDYVSIVENKGLAIKEIRFMLRSPTQPLGQWPLIMSQQTTGQSQESGIKIFATTTAYENDNDVGIGSPNVLCIYEKQSFYLLDNVTGTYQYTWRDDWFGTPDLHPEGYDVVTDLLIGVCANKLTALALASDTQEIDVMIIAEPKKITSKDLTQMLTQAQDL